MTQPSTSFGTDHLWVGAPLPVVPTTSEPVSRNERSPAKRTIVHVSLGTDVGGMEKLLVEFARWADRSRFNLHFVSLEKPGAAAEEIARCGWDVISMNKSSGFRPDLVVTLSRRLRQLRPDVVHTHNTAGYLYGVSASVLARVPRVIHTRHGQRFEASKRQTLSFRWLSRWVDQVVSVSEDGRRLTIDEGIEDQRACTIRNGIDLDRFRYIGPTPGGPVVMVARLSREKDVATLLHAMAIVGNNFADSDPPLRLDIVGDGSERVALERLSRQLGVESSVSFLGHRDNIHDALSGASMFVLPSLTEGISLTLLEAMACGLPVVATQVGGTPEVVLPGVTGTLVPPRDPTAMAEAMMQLWLDPDMASRYGLQGRQRVELEFGIQKMVHQYKLMYVAEVTAQ